MSKVLQIDRDVRSKIIRAEYVDRIPSAAALAQEYAVNFKTVNKAFANLVEEGLLACAPGRGTYVCPGARERLLADSKSHVGNRLVAVFMPQGPDLYGPLYNALARVLNEHDKFPMMIENAGRQALLDVLRLNPAAIVVDLPVKDACGGREEFPYELLKEHIGDVPRVVFLHRMESEIEFDADYVLCDHSHGTYTATRHLLGLGHRRILFLTHPHHLNVPPLIYRRTVPCAMRQGYQLAMEEAGSAEQYFFYDALHVEESRDRFAALLADPARRPTAILSDTDARMFQFRDLIRAAGLRVPQDLALMGFYDLEGGAHFDPPLTSVSIREDELATLAAGRILSDDPHHERILLTPKLIVRHSCGARQTKQKGGQYDGA